MFGDVLGLIVCSLFTIILICLSSGSRVNLDSSVSMTLPQSDTVQLTCSQAPRDSPNLYVKTKTLSASKSDRDNEKGMGEIF